MALTSSLELYSFEVHPWYRDFASKVSYHHYVEAMDAQMETTITFLKSIEPSRWDFRYAPEKWSIRQVVQHVIDAERVYAYRALRFARNDRTILPGFDEDNWSLNSGADERTIDSLITEYRSVRKASKALFGNLSDEMRDREGTANGIHFSVRLCGVIITGHDQHHMEIIRSRYL